MLVEKGERLGAEIGAGREFLRGLVCDAEAEAKPFIGRDARFHRSHFFPDRGEVFRPTLAGVDVQAIGEMKRGGVLDDHRARVEVRSS